MPVHVDVQVVAATNRDLELEVAEGRFREDLYYRLNMVEFNVPPLRQRVDDIPHFVEYFSRKFAARYQRPLWRPNGETLRQFCEYRWPGNIRQLANVIEQAYVLDCEPRLPERTDSRRIAEASLPFMDLAQAARCRRATSTACNARSQEPRRSVVGRASQYDDTAAGSDSQRRRPADACGVSRARIVELAARIEIKRGYVFRNVTSRSRGFARVTLHSSTRGDPPLAAVVFEYREAAWPRRRGLSTKGSPPGSRLALAALRTHSD